MNAVIVRTAFISLAGLVLIVGMINRSISRNVSATLNLLGSWAGVFISATPFLAFLTAGGRFYSRISGHRRTSGVAPSETRTTIVPSTTDSQED